MADRGTRGSSRQRPHRPKRLTHQTPKKRALTARPGAAPPIMAIFPTAGQLLKALGACLQSTSEHNYRLFQGPACFAFEAEGAWQKLSPLMNLAGGRVYTQIGDHWRLLGALQGEQSGPPPLQHSSLEDILSKAALTTGQWGTQQAVTVIGPPPLIRWAEDRALKLGVETELRTANARPMGQSVQGTNVALLSLWHESALPPSLLHALEHMPKLIVCAGRLSPQHHTLVHLGAHLPIQTENLVPEGTVWVIGPPEEGRYCLNQIGETLPPHYAFQQPDLIHPQALRAPKAPPGQTSNTRLILNLLPTPLPTDIHGVLLDEQEWTWLNIWLQGSPMTRTAHYLNKGPWHLILGTDGPLPLGQPLHRIGPGPLFIRADHQLSPPLSPPARLAAFDINPEEICVFLGEQAVRFSLEALQPLWGPFVDHELVPSAGPNALHWPDLQLTEAQNTLNETLGLLEAQQETHHSQLMRLARQAELEGQHLNAAQLFEEAGALAEAGRLYQQAAGPQ